MKETWRKLDGFGFVQWFALVCCALLGAISFFILGSLVWDSFHSGVAWKEAVVTAFCALSPFIGAYSGARIYHKRQF